MDIVLLITGCIAPSKNQDDLYIYDEEIRLHQYIDSIRFYIENTKFDKIVFCENSNYLYNKIAVLQEFASLFNKHFEWIAFSGNACNVEKFGKGWGEDEIVDYALTNSQLLMDAPAFAKVTGRLILQNADDMIKSCDIYSNYFFRDIYRHHKLAVDTRFYVVNKDFYNSNLRQYCKRDYLNAKTTALEDVYFYLLNGRYKQFNHFFRFVGISGGNGRDYSKLPKAMKIAIDAFVFFRIYNKLFFLLCLYRGVLYRLFRIKL